MNINHTGTFSIDVAATSIVWNFSMPNQSDSKTKKSISNYLSYNLDY